MAGEWYLLQKPWQPSTVVQMKAIETKEMDTNSRMEQTTKKMTSLGWNKGLDLD